MTKPDYRLNRWRLVYREPATEARYREATRPRNLADAQSALILVILINLPFALLDIQVGGPFLAGFLAARFVGVTAVFPYRFLHGLAVSAATSVAFVGAVLFDPGIVASDFGIICGQGAARRGPLPGGRRALAARQYFCPSARQRNRIKGVASAKVSAT
ncbi:MAG: hypothetical protein FJX68_10925 [Alphaproteobacteria bacterium]|nr:hypothetical protein [Alphaproteobacteria bacterium]